MVPQQAPYYPSGAPPVYGQSGFFPANFAPQHQGLAVQVGIPAGAAPGFGSVAQQAVVHVSGGVGGHSNNAHPLPFSTNNQQTHFVQGQPSNFVQVVGSNSGFADPSSANLHGQWQGQPRLPRSPPPSSFPPGFEPGQNNNVAMGVPSQAVSNIVATGGLPNQHQLQHQHQHQHQGHHDYQQQHQHEHPYQQHHQHQNQLQLQHQHQHQHQHQGHHDYQQQHQHEHPYQHHQHQNQHKHQNPHQHQNQHQNQCQHQHPHQHQLQHHPQHQHQHQHQHQLQLQHHPQHQHQQYQHPHHPQLQLHTQPQPATQLQLQSQFQPQLQPQAHPQTQAQAQPQSHPQLQTSCQQMQPSQLTSVLFSNSYPPNFQASGVAIGLPVMGAPSHADATSTQKVVQIQQPAPAAWQASYPEKSSLPECQSSKSTVAATNSFQDNPAQVVAPKRDPYSRPTNIQRIEQSHVEAPADPSQKHGQLMPPSKPDSKFCMEGMEPPDAQRTSQTQSNGHPASGTSCPSSVMENNHRQWLSPPNVQMRSWVNGRNPPHAFRDFQPHSNGQFKSHMKLPFSAAGEKRRDGQHLSQSQKPRDSRGKVFSKGVEKRSDMQPLRCDPCDRTFTSSEIMTAHLNSHVKCGEEGCTFESTGKILKEHKVVEHGKIDVQSTYRGRKALALRSMEDKEDIRRWREERKKSYPTSANIQLKAEERKRKEAEGEFFDEEVEKRRQRMRDVIARQKQLGFQVPEIPSHYFHKRYDRRPKKSRVDSSIELPVVRKETAIADVTDGKAEFVDRRGIRTADDSHDRSMTVEEKSSQKNSDLKNDNQDMESLHEDKPIDNDNGFRGQGHARKGYQGKFMSSRERRKQHHSYDTRIAGPRQPTLLSKLLHDDIQKENSYLLQCCRFIVNNAFLQDCSPSSLKHFEWIGAAMSANEDSAPANTIDSNAQMKLEMGEMVPTLSDSEYSACGEEIHTLSNSKDSVAEAKLVNPSSSNTKDLSTSAREIEDAPHASVTSQIRGKKKEEQYLVHKEQPETNVGQPCLRNNTGKVKPHDPQSNHVAADKVVGGVQTSVSSWKPTSTNTHLSYHDMEAGEVASGNSESIVEDEEDISQYMNFDVTGADSGCCYD